MRDEFSKATKEKLAKRVAYRCSHPDCPIITVGPGHRSADHVVNLGDAAHITAASPGGPRYDSTLSTEQRSSFENGIWMCKHHANLIDKDENKYSAATLRLWKAQAEIRAEQELEHIGKPVTTEPSTLISLTHKLIFFGVWKSVTDNIWAFRVGDFLEGNILELKRFSINQSNRGQSDRFIVVESEGDGREMEKFTWKLSDDQYYEIYCTVLPQAPRISPHQVGTDLALGDDLDLFFADGDLATVKGMDAALQIVRLSLSTPYGSIFYARESGSFVPHYFQKYQNNTLLLQRLIKLELSRLLTVSVHDDIQDPHSRAPELNFVSKVLAVDVLSFDTSKNLLPLRLSLEWGDGEMWTGEVSCSVNSNLKVEDSDDDL